MEGRGGMGGGGQGKGERSEGEEKGLWVLDFLFILSNYGPSFVFCLIVIELQFFRELGQAN